VPSVSQRARSTPSSPIRKLAGYASEAKARGVEIFHLNIGQPDVPSPDSFWKAIRTFDVPTVEYTHSAGFASLREAAVTAYKGYGIHVNADQLLVTNGASEATLFAFLTLFEPGDEVIVCEPYYANYTTFALMAGVKLVPLTTKIEENFALPDISEIEKRISARTKGLLLCNPSNPTGTGFTKSMLDRLGDLALRNDLFLLVDEVYRDFFYDGEAPTSILSYPGLEKHAVMLDSVSKRLSLCGARIGFLVSRNEEVIANALKYAQARLSPPTIEQVGAEAAILGTPPEYFASVKQEYRRRRDLVTSALRAMPGVLCPKIEGAFYAIVRLPIDDCDRFCQWLLTDFQIDGKTVMLSPASGFYLTPGLGKDEVRIAYVLKEASLKAAMECLGAALKVYPGRREEARIA
jgi:aspartate aminotransferase